VLLDDAALGIGRDQSREDIKPDGVVALLYQPVEDDVPILQLAGRIMAQQPGEVPHGDRDRLLQFADAFGALGVIQRSQRARLRSTTRKHGQGRLLQEITSGIHGGSSQALHSGRGNHLARACNTWKRPRPSDDLRNPHFDRQVQARCTPHVNDGMNKVDRFFLREAMPDPNVVTHFASTNLISTIERLLGE
jgi:hypothetical protein